MARRLLFSSRTRRYDGGFGKQEMRNPEREVFLFRRRLGLAGVLVLVAFGGLSPTVTLNARVCETYPQVARACVEAGIAVEIVPVTLMGLIAPVTVVGATVFHTVDVLAGIGGRVPQGHRTADRPDVRVGREMAGTVRGDDVEDADDVEAVDDVIDDVAPAEALESVA